MKKRLLFVSVNFFSYTALGVQELEKHGYAVTFYDCRPPLTPLAKWRMKHHPRYAKRVMDRYAEKIIAENQGVAFDLVIFNSTVFFTREQIARILKAFPSSEKRLWLWDSISTYPQMESYLSLFDRQFSFDPADCEKYRLEYLPDYYDSECLKNEAETKAPSSDICFIGSVWPERYAFLERFKKAMEKEGLVCSFHYYVSSPKIFWFYKLTSKEFRHAKKKDFIFKPIPLAQKNAIEQASRAFVDIHVGAQVGLSMRSIESAVMGKKLITTCPQTTTYDIYDPHNVALITEMDFSAVSAAFVRSSFIPLASDPKSRYSVARWAEDILGAKKA